MIFVEDLNDNAPVIRVNALTENGYAEIQENLPVGAFVAHVSVTDVDTGSGGQVDISLSIIVSVLLIHRQAVTCCHKYQTQNSDKNETDYCDIISALFSLDTQHISVVCVCVCVCTNKTKIKQTNQTDRQLTSNPRSLLVETR